MTYRVRPLRKAQQDVDAILTGIIDERKTPQGAAAWLEAYDTAAAAIANNPERHSHAPENSLLDFELRQFLFKTKKGRMYRGIFTIVQDSWLCIG
jgi:plasmid stabilization system protein ParE